MGQHKTWQERRDQLIEATIASIHDDGLEKTSVQRIAKRAGLTAGIVGHYFGDKENLFDATYSALYEQILSNAQKVSESGGSASDRLKRILLCYISPDQLRPEIITAWYFLVARLRSNNAIHKRQSEAELTIRKMCYDLIRAELSDSDAEILSRALFAMITGFWVSMASDPEPQTYDENRRAAIAVIDRFLGAYRLK